MTIIIICKDFDVSLINQTLVQGKSRLIDQTYTMCTCTMYHNMYHDELSTSHIVVKRLDWILRIQNGCILTKCSASFFSVQVYKSGYVRVESARKRNVRIRHGQWYSASATSRGLLVVTDNFHKSSVDLVACYLTAT